MVINLPKLGWSWMTSLQLDILFKIRFVCVWCIWYKLIFTSVKLVMDLVRIWTFLWHSSLGFLLVFESWYSIFFLYLNQKETITRLFFGVSLCCWFQDMHIHSHVFCLAWIGEFFYADALTIVCKRKINHINVIGKLII